MRFRQIVSIGVLPICLCGVPAHAGSEDRALQAAAAKVTLCGRAAPKASAAVCGFSLVADRQGPQLAVMQPAGMLLASVRRGESVEVAIPLSGLPGSVRVTAEVSLVSGSTAEVQLTSGGAGQARTLGKGQTLLLEVACGGEPPAEIALRTATAGDEAAVRWRKLRALAGGPPREIPIAVPAADPQRTPPPVLAELRVPIEQALVEWDWRMQDGIGTPREPRSYSQAIEATLRRGDDLLRDLRAEGVSLAAESAEWAALRQTWEAWSARDAGDPAWEDLWRRVHAVRRRIALANPRAPAGPLVFVKQATASFSHQLTQYLGKHARPGGGLFVLERPGQSMRCRQLGGAALPLGSYLHPEVSYEGDRILFAFCKAETAPPLGIEGRPERHYHLYEATADGQRVRQLTDGPYNDFSPRYLPNGQIVFISTRRGGWHRCGGSPGKGCENHTLALMEADGSRPHPISFHETQEWDPAVLHDGRIIYTRWDYVDRHAVYYEQLWAARPDGTNPMIYFGNNTFNPVGIWEPMPVPGSTKVMATAAPHHAMTAGSIILVDVNQGVDGLPSITRLTPDALFPESETKVLPRNWYAPAGITVPPAVPVEAARWPGHCYKSPYPLSESYFLASYSYDALIGEPDANPVNMFGIYLVDRFGNKELLYRDLNISSLWAAPLRPRNRPAAAESLAQAPSTKEGILMVQNVYASDPPLPPGSIQRLRVVQVLPKSTPGINWPRLGVPNASPGKQVLGTVPVEADGSAHFRAPAGIPFSLQALDARGCAVQIMRSIVYLQPGEVVACAGCHERRNTTPPPDRPAAAMLRPPSIIQPGPDGSRPLSYPLLVQPVLDRYCVQCHNPQKPDGNVVLTGEPQKPFTVSYNALASRVTYSAWGGKPGDFRVSNCEPISQPKFFGSISSPLTKLLLDGHYGVALSDDEFDRLVTWMDANVLFYGTFNHADQARQLRGERIDGPDFQ
mgnify:CR=1 FL=1